MTDPKLTAMDNAHKAMISARKNYFLYPTEVNAINLREARDKFHKLCVVYNTSKDRTIRYA